MAEWRCPNCGRSYPSQRFETGEGCTDCAPTEGTPPPPPRGEPEVQANLGLLNGFAALLGVLAFLSGAAALIFFLALLMDGQPLVAFGSLLLGLLQIFIFMALASVIRLLLVLERRSRPRNPAPPDNA